MATTPLYCLTSTTFVSSTVSAINPINSITVSQPSNFLLSANYSDLGTKLYYNDYDNEGNGDYELLTTPNIWLNNSIYSGPLYRSGVWSNNVDHSPFNYWIGVSYVFNLLESTLYYFGVGGDNAITLRVNGINVISQHTSTATTDNYRYWHVYPIILNGGKNIIEILGLNISGIARFGMEIYDNTYDDLFSATSINDLNIIFSTNNYIGEMFTSVYSTGFTKSNSGFTCNTLSENQYTFDPTSSKPLACVAFSSVTTNLCSSNLIRSAVKFALAENPGEISSVGYGFKMINGKLSDKLAIIFTCPFVDPGLSPNIPKTINFSGFTFDTDKRLGINVSTQINSPNPLPWVSCGAFSEDWKTITQPNKLNAVRPLVGGLGWTGLWDAFKAGGTMGALVIDNETNALMGLTNGHCFSPVPEFTLTKDPAAFINPPSLYPNNQGWCWFLSTPSILQGGLPTWNSTLHQWIGYDPNNILGIAVKFYPVSSIPDPFVPSTGPLNKIDAALFSVKEEDIDYEISFKQYGMTGWELPLSFATTQELDDLLLTKPFFFSVGATTGVKGESDVKLVISQNFVVFNVDGIVGKNCFFEDYVGIVASAETTPSGFVCGYPIYFGDSGSIVTAEFNGVRKIVGIASVATYGGAPDPNPPPGMGVGGAASVQLGFCRIDHVASLLNISPWSGQTVNFLDPNLIIDECLPGLSNVPTKVLSGMTFWQIGLCGPENGF